MKTDDFIANLTADGARKPLPHPLRITGFWLAGIVCLCAVVTVFLGIRPDISAKWQEPYYLMEMAAALATAISALFAASWLALPDVGQRPAMRFLPIIPLMLFAGLLGIGVANFHGHISLIECLHAARFDCLIYIALFSVLPTAVMFVTIEKAAPVRCCWAGGMAALAAASFGYVLLRLTSVNDNPMLLIVWLFMPVIAVAMLGMMCGGVYFKRSTLWQ